MPSYVNIGAWVGAGSMVDTWATVGSCAQIGERVHLSGGVGIGGVLEPPNAVPVVVEDDAFVGSRCMVTGGARVGKGAVLGAGSILDPSIPVIDAETGEEISRGVVPPWCVAIRASRRREYPGGEFFVPCVLVIKRLERGRAPRQGAAERGPAGPRRQHLIRWATCSRPPRDLMAVPSVEPAARAPLADLVEDALRACPWLEVERVGDNVVARTALGRDQRLVLAGHLDTVPAGAATRRRGSTATRCGAWARPT